MNKEILDIIKENQVIGIVPARSGSKGVKNKNIRCLQGYPMIAYSIAAALMSETIDRVVVSTDSEEYARIAAYYGAEVPFIRPSELASDKSTDIEFMEHAIIWLYNNERSVPEYFVHLRPTYPLRDYRLIDNAVMRMKNDSKATSLRSAHKADVSPFKWFQFKDDNKYFKPMYDDMTLDDSNKPRQAFPDVYIPDGYVDVLRTSNIVQNDCIHGNCMIGFIVDDGVDVDTMKDMEQIEKKLQKAEFPVLSYLRENYKPLEEAKL